MPHSDDLVAVYVTLLHDGVIAYASREQGLTCQGYIKELKRARGVRLPQRGECAGLGRAGTKTRLF